jgi:hypothetical protein
MRVRTDYLFRTTEALRKRIEELELANSALIQALRTANNDNVSLARRVQYVENKLRQLNWAEEFIPPEG